MYKYYKLISGKKNYKRRKDKNTCDLKIIWQHVCQIKRKNIDRLTKAKR